MIINTCAYVCRNCPKPCLLIYKDEDAVAPNMCPWGNIPTWTEYEGEFL